MAGSDCEDYDKAFLEQFKDRPLTAVAVGKTGKGKSSTLNSILRVIEQENKAFKATYFTSCGGPDSVTEAVKNYEFSPDGFPRCRIVDTVGLFDTKLTQEEKDSLNFDKMSCIDEEHRLVLDQFLEVMKSCKEGIDAFFFVLKATDRATKEELDTINIIFRYLGWNMLEYVVFVITGKDEATPEAFEGWKNHVCKVLESKGYPQKHVRERFIFVDNKNPTLEQAYDLLNRVRYVSDITLGKPYTPVAFQQAQEMLEKEKKKIKAELDQKFNEKVDEKLKPIEAKHQKAMSGLQERVAKTEAEGAKLREAQVAERKKFDNELAALKIVQEKEKKRLADEKQQIIDRLEREKQAAYDRERKEMTAMLAQLASQMQQTQKDIYQRYQEAQRELERRIQETIAKEKAAMKNQRHAAQDAVDRHQESQRIAEQRLRAERNGSSCSTM